MSRLSGRPNATPEIIIIIIGSALRRPSKIPFYPMCQFIRMDYLITRWKFHFAFYSGAHFLSAFFQSPIDKEFNFNHIHHTLSHCPLLAPSTYLLSSSHHHLRLLGRNDSVLRVRCDGTICAWPIMRTPFDSIVNVCFFFSSVVPSSSCAHVPGSRHRRWPRSFFIVSLNYD